MNPIIVKQEDTIDVCLDMNSEVISVGEEMEKINDQAYMNGYNWEAFFNYYLPRYAPDIFKGMRTDSEAQTYVAIYDLTPENEAKAEKLVNIIRNLLENKEELYRIVREEGDKIEWD